MTILDQLLSAAKESAHYLTESKIGTEAYEIGIKLYEAIAACEIKEPQAESTDQTQKELI